MANCVECEKEFDIAEAREEYNAEFHGEVDYDEQYPEGGFCGGCAAAQSSSYLNHGTAILMMNGEVDYDDDFVTQNL
ncbi:hypothetical protein ADK87_16425 [Streptomyces sp. NRRL F-4711]|uniref:hypothetical protein n=1 Tax=unclassified Streptomyces TaxID=2593676 RepID=UPI0004BFDA35|nr:MULTISPECIES: hypothetical protein [unclassified Streptomyces]KOT98084.1 hypothetical protein ADK87_16425 [Streptomyces sp. NRRL F-4711]